jgi:hypothetical protein
MADLDPITPLDDHELDLIRWLAIYTIATQMDATPEAVAAALDQFAAEGRSVLRWTATDAYLEVAGHPLVHCARDWLHFMAHRPNPAMN